MSNDRPTATQLAETFFEALETRDISLIDRYLADDVVEVIPYSNTGKPEPFYVFTGKAEVLDYLRTIVTNFSRVLLAGKRYSVTDDGNTVFLQAEGDLVQAGTDAAYRNVYVFKIETRDGQIVHIDEYANPITYALLAGLPLG
ncbi:nuclear transport factor 2 family protein [Paractinoplanes lichenicola]|uniref:Nuclear transport factor 2 family protein n=1 Tax=Paractinoplanes lichenicola TaxID=2802976 RepID=A0ABS1VI30_9ACTN|nr:nuclear transport factor 2 family protein [Actinoplanes lichenicola]MBL7253111.1 nuclear transport factor 2 family protein [Actinoplanes lichenicola]